MDKYLLNDGLLNRLREHLTETGFKTVDELIEYILEDYLKQNTATSNSQDIKIADEVNQRLKDLGYL